jgi:hypothetical protein
MSPVFRGSASMDLVGLHCHIGSNVFDIGHFAEAARTMVDLAWLQEVQAAPWSEQPRPSYVRLPSPGFPPHRAWASWFAWLDAGAYLLPAGPSHWLAVGFPLRYGPVELERALNYGSFCMNYGSCDGMQCEYD